MNKNFKLEGILPALITPFCEDGVTINEDSVKKLVDLHIKQGAEGFYIIGGTGEGIVLSREQREIMCEYAVKHIGGRKTVINHVAAVNFNEAIELAKHAEKNGVDAIAAIPPVFFSYTEEDIYNYYKRLADAVSIPLIIYYHPSAQPKMSVELLARIFEIDNVTGVKWSSTNFFEMMKLKEKTHGEMNIINGPDELLVSGLAAGADAGIGSTYNIMLPQFIEVYKNFKSGNMEKAMEIQRKINNVITAILKNDLIPAVKYAVNLMGIDAGNAVFPMKQYNAEDKKALERDLADAGWPFV